MGADNSDATRRSEVVYTRPVPGEVVAVAMRNGDEVARASGKNKRQALLNLIKVVSRMTDAEL